MAGEFIKKLSHLKKVSADEEAAIRQTFDRMRELQKGETLFTDGETQDHLYIVKSGWFYSYAILTDGSRQIHDVFTAGDVIGMENLSWMNATSSVACAVSGKLYATPVIQTQHLLKNHPSLNRLFQTLQMVHNILLIDRLTAISRLDAYNRVAYFLSDALARQNLRAETHSDLLKMPLSQTFIADCLGLSSVHVSRQFGKLMKKGLIRKAGQKNIEILDWQDLQIEGDYKNRFSNLVLSRAPR